MSILGFWFYDAWEKCPRKADDLFQVPWFSDMWAAAADGTDREREVLETP